MVYQVQLNMFSFH